MKNITRFPHAQGTADMPDVLGHGTHHAVTKTSEAQARALVAASLNFMDKYDRLPDWDIILFRGCFHTTGVEVEIWEEG